MSGEQFYINYSLNGEHYAMGPYHTRRFATSHIDDIRRQPGASNVYLGNKPPDDKSYLDDSSTEFEMLVNGVRADEKV